MQIEFLGHACKQPSGLPTAVEDFKAYYTCLKYLLSAVKELTENKPEKGIIPFNEEFLASWPYNLLVISRKQMRTARKLLFTDLFPSHINGDSGG